MSKCCCFRCALLLLVLLLPRHFARFLARVAVGPHRIVRREHDLVELNPRPRLGHHRFDFGFPVLRVLSLRVERLRVRVPEDFREQVFFRGVVFIVFVFFAKNSFENVKS